MPTPTQCDQLADFAADLFYRFASPTPDFFDHIENAEAADWLAASPDPAAESLMWAIQHGDDKLVERFAVLSDRVLRGLSLDDASEFVATWRALLLDEAARQVRFCLARERVFDGPNPTRSRRHYAQQQADSLHGVSA